MCLGWRPARDQLYKYCVGSKWPGRGLPHEYAEQQLYHTATQTALQLLCKTLAAAAAAAVKMCVCFRTMYSVACSCEWSGEISVCCTHTRTTAACVHVFLYIFSLTELYHNTAVPHSPIVLRSAQRLMLSGSQSMVLTGCK